MTLRGHTGYPMPQTYTPGGRRRQAGRDKRRAARPLPSGPCATPPVARAFLGAGQRRDRAPLLTLAHVGLVCTPVAPGRRRRAPLRTWPSVLQRGPSAHADAPRRRVCRGTPGSSPGAPTTSTRTSRTSERFLVRFRVVSLDTRAVPLDQPRPTSAPSGQQWASGRPRIRVELGRHSTDQAIDARSAPSSMADRFADLHLTLHIVT